MYCEWSLNKTIGFDFIKVEFVQKWYATCSNQYAKKVFSQMKWPISTKELKAIFNKRIDDFDSETKRLYKRRESKQDKLLNELDVKWKQLVKEGKVRNGVRGNFNRFKVNKIEEKWHNDWMRACDILSYLNNYNFYERRHQLRENILINNTKELNERLNRQKSNRSTCKHKWEYLSLIYYEYCYGPHHTYECNNCGEIIKTYDDRSDGDYNLGA